MPLPFVSFRIRETKLDDLNAFAAKAGRSRSAIIKEAIERYLAEYSQKSQQMENRAR